MGLGKFGGGADTAAFAAKAGARVTVTDKAPPFRLYSSLEQLCGINDIEYQIGFHTPSTFETADIVVKNPAVPNNHSLLDLARKKGAEVTTRINLFMELAPPETKIIGITGSNGKSTTASLTAHLLSAAAESGRAGFRKAWLSGNIGNRPLLRSLNQIRPDDVVVLELSSFQTEMLPLSGKAPDISILTNLTPNHLDRHGTFESYCSAKEQMFILQNSSRNKTVISIFNSEDPVSRSWLEKYRKQTDRISIGFSPDLVSGELSRSFRLPGRANRSNLAAAAAAARALGVREKDMTRCLPGFCPLPHRLEPVANINGVDWYNDSISTTPESTIAALEAFDSPGIIIAGGYDKGIDLTAMARKAAAEARAVIVMGATANTIASLVLREKPSATLISAASLSEAVDAACRLAEPGDAVILSPGCASYDMFESFRQRGNEFKRLVLEKS